jgi:Phosphotransferase enzyme family
MTDILNLLKKHILDNWDYFDLGINRPQELWPTYTERSVCARGNIVYRGLKISAKKKARPIIYIRLLPISQKDRRMREIKNLKQLSDNIHSQKLRKTLLARKLVLKSQKFCFIISRYGEGQPLDELLVQNINFKKILNYADKSLSWLTLLQRDRISFRKFNPDHLSGELTCLKRKLNVLPVKLKKYISSLRIKAVDFKVAKFPQVYQHGDFGTANIIFKGTEINYVFDWENFSIERSPFIDFINFLIVFTGDIAPYLKSRPRMLAKYLRWIKERINIFCKEFALPLDYFEFYSKITLIEILTFYLKKSRDIKGMSGKRILGLSIFGFPVFYGYLGNSLIGSFEKQIADFG